MSVPEWLPTRAKANVQPPTAPPRHMNCDHLVPIARTGECEQCNQLPANRTAQR